jgi:hypothetical protein
MAPHATPADTDVRGAPPTERPVDEMVKLWLEAAAYRAALQVTRTTAQPSLQAFLS